MGGKVEVELAQPHALPGQPTIQCALRGWHAPHGYGHIRNSPDAVREGSGWCPGVTPDEVRSAPGGGHSESDGTG